MSERAIQPLEYATPIPAPGIWSHFRVGALLFAVLGIAANVALVALTVPRMYRATWAHRDLVQDPRAYGRQIAPETIATLRRPVRLWTSAGLLIGAASFGLLLAINLLCATVHMRRDTSRASRRLRFYGRLKPFGAAVTALAFLWFGAESHALWVAATAHWPVGSSDAPYLASATLLGCAWLPAWWVRTRGGVEAG